jgi:hypothetical protein
MAKEEFTKEDICDCAVDELNSVITECQALRNLVQHVSVFSREELLSAYDRVLRLSASSAELLGYVNSVKCKHLSMMDLRVSGSQRLPVLDFKAPPVTE